MPDPIRTRSMPILPAALFDEGEHREGEPASVFAVDSERVPSWQRVQGAAAGDDEASASLVDTRLPVRDSYDRGAPVPQKVQGPSKSEWTHEPLAKYLKGVAAQIEANLQKHGTPPVEKLDAFIHRLVLNTQRQTRHAPKKVRHLFSTRLIKFWNFVRNEKIRSTTPEELKASLMNLADSLQELNESSRNNESQVPLVRPIPIRGAPLRGGF